MKQSVLRRLVACASIFVLGVSGMSQVVSAEEATTVKISSLSSDAQTWKYIAESKAAKEAGLKIEVIEVNGGPENNQTVADGEVDANAFQSLGYLDTFNQESKTKLVPIATTYIEPMGIYSKKYTAIKDVADGATVAISNDPANGARGLQLLEKAGLIKLHEKETGLVTVGDIKENPKHLKIDEIDDRTGPRILPDVDLVLIGNTVALEGGLNVLKDALVKEEVDDKTKAIINVIAVKQGRENETALKKLGEVYHTEEIQDYIKKEFEGTKVPVKKEVKEVWELKP